jgi:hypothetical protein
MSLRHSLLTRCLASLLAIGLFAACGDDSPENPTGTTMTDEMSDDSMTDTTMTDEMSDDSMTDTTMADDMSDDSMTDTTSG